MWILQSLLKCIWQGAGRKLLQCPLQFGIRFQPMNLYNVVKVSNLRIKLVEKKSRWLTRHAKDFCMQLHRQPLTYNFWRFLSILLAGSHLRYRRANLDSSQNKQKTNAAIKIGKKQTGPPSRADRHCTKQKNSFSYKTKAPQFNLRFNTQRPKKTPGMKCWD